MSSEMPPAAEPSLINATSTPFSEGMSTAETPGPKKDSNLDRRVCGTA
jgi:nitrous oxide reductase accessory protein NosL